MAITQGRAERLGRQSKKHAFLTFLTFLACNMLQPRNMKSVVFRAKKSGGFVEATLEPVKERRKVSFGLVDFVLIAAILLCSCGLVCLIITR